MDCNTLLVKHCFCGCGCDHNVDENGGISDEIIADLQKELTGLKEKVEEMTNCSCGGISGGGNIGEIFWWPTITPPGDSLYCDGREISRVDYQNLFQVIGTNFGEGDGEATFNLPDLRGEFIRGYDPDATRDPNGRARGMGQHQDATELPYVCRITNLALPAATGTHPRNMDKEFTKTNSFGSVSTGTAAVNSLPTLYTTRPTNINLLPCIRYKSITGTIFADNEITKLKHLLDISELQA